MVGYSQYGDDEIFNNEDFKSRNLRGRVFRRYDQSGLITTERFDFKGNPLTTRRRLAEDYAGDINWQTAENLLPDQEPDNLLMAEAFDQAAEAFTQITEYDALNRIVRQYTWHKGVGSRIAFGGFDADLRHFRQVGIDPDGQVQVFVVHELVQGFHAAGPAGTVKG